MDFLEFVAIVIVGSGVLAALFWLTKSNFLEQIFGNYFIAGLVAMGILALIFMRLLNVNVQR